MPNLVPYQHPGPNDPNVPMSQTLWNDFLNTIDVDLDSKTTAATLLGSTGSSLVGFLQSGTGAAARTTESKLREIYSVKDFGVVGDGTTDDTANIQAAINAVIAAGGGTLFFPAGSYKITSALTCDGDYIFLKGVGPGSKLLLASAAIDGVVFGNGTTARTFCGVSDMEINVTGVTKSAGAAIRYRKVQSGFTYNLRIANQFLGWQITDSVLIYSDDDTLLNPIATTGGGVLIESTNGAGASSNDHYFTNLFLQGQTSQPAFGIKITQSTGSWFTGGGALQMGYGLLIDVPAGSLVENIFCSGWIAFDQCTNNGIRITADSGGTARTLRFTDTWSASHGQEGVILAGAGTFTNIRFVNMEVKNNAKEGMVLNNGNVFHVIGGHFESNGTAAANTYSAIRVAANLEQFSIRDTVCTGPNQKYGIEILTGTGNNYQIINNDCRTNGVGAIFDGGTGTSKQVYGNLPLSDIDTFSVGGGAGIRRILSATTTWDPVSVPNGSSTATLVGVTGAEVGDPVFVGFSSLTGGNWQIGGTVNTTNQVTVSLFNATGSAGDLPSGTLRVVVFKFR